MIVAIFTMLISEILIPALINSAIFFAVIRGFQMLFRLITKAENDDSKLKKYTLFISLFLGLIAAILALYFR